MENSLTGEDWEILIQRIQDRQCTPFLGAGMCSDVLPLGRDVAQQWAQKFDYPMDDPHDLIKVAQFVALVRDPVTPKEEFLRLIKNSPRPNYSDPSEPHSILASLRLPVYITTNYDDFMFQALVKKDRDAKREICHWNSYTKNRPSIFGQNPGYEPTLANPLVFHLHGSDELATSLVLTEDDYLDFLVNVSHDQQLLPPVIQRALTETSLLYIGYRIVDWNFRVLMQSFRRFMERSSAHTSFAVMPLPRVDDEARRKIQQYLKKFYANIDVKVYWGTAQEFLTDLLERAGPSLLRL
jgi:hypothetical protein